MRTARGLTCWHPFICPDGSLPVRLVLGSLHSFKVTFPLYLGADFTFHLEAPKVTNQQGHSMNKAKEKMKEGTTHRVAVLSKLRRRKKHRPLSSAGLAKPRGKPEDEGPT